MESKHGNKNFRPDTSFTKLTANTPTDLPADVYKQDGVGVGLGTTISNALVTKMKSRTCKSFNSRFYTSEYAGTFSFFIFKTYRRPSFIFLKFTSCLND